MITNKNPYLNTMRLNPEHLPLDEGNPIKGIIHAANESRFTSSHYSEPLTEFTVGWNDPEDLGALLNFIAPTIHVGRRFEFKKADNAEAFFSESDDVRAIGSAFKRVEYTGESIHEKTLNKGLTIRIDHDDIVGENWRERYVQLLLKRLYRNELRRALAALNSAAEEKALTWSEDGKLCNPDKDLREALFCGAEKSGIRPNRIVFGEGAWYLRANAYDCQQSAGAFRSASLTPDELRAKLFVEDVKIVGARYQSDMKSKSQIVGNEIFTFFAQNTLEKDEPSNLKRFITPVESGDLFRVYVEERAKYTDISVEHYSSIVVTSSLGITKMTVGNGA